MTLRILVSNDDGYFSPGIAALVQAASPFGEVTVVAPEMDRSGASNSLTLDRPLYVRQAASGYFYVNGTPTDCVHIAVTGFLDFRPDLVISGINHGQNVAEDTLYSGTVAAAMEGFLLGIPAVAFSLADRGFAHLETAASVARQVIEGLVKAPLSQNMLLNVNIPAVPLAELRGIRATRLGRRHVSQPVIKTQSPRGESLYWVGPAGDVKDASPGTDFHALATGYASVTALRVDLGDESKAAELEPWLKNLSAPV